MLYLTPSKKLTGKGKIIVDILRTIGNRQVKANILNKYTVLKTDK